MPPSYSNINYYQLSLLILQHIKVKMIEKKVTVLSLHDSDQTLADLEYWLSRTPEERISAVEILRRQYYGTGTIPGIQRVVRIIQQASC